MFLESCFDPLHAERKKEGTARGRETEGKSECEEREEEMERGKRGSKTADLVSL